MRSLIVAVVLWAGIAHADAPKSQIAMLPLDADAKLEVYSNPVATELARALTAGGFDVVVVNGKMSVPATARLVVDGTIRLDKANAVTLTAHIRDPKDPDVSKIVPVTEPATMKTMDHAAEELSSKLLAAVKTRIAELDLAAQQHKDTPPPDNKHPVVTAPPMSKLLLASVTIDAKADGAKPLEAALSGALPAWAQKRHHELKLVPTHTAAEQTGVIAEKADLAIIFDVLKLTVEPGDIPLARAIVNVKISDVTGIVWFRTVQTNTVVGDKGLSTDKLAERVAREVLQIVDPHLKRKIGSWK